MLFYLLISRDRPLETKQASRDKRQHGSSTGPCNLPNRQRPSIRSKSGRLDCSFVSCIITNILKLLCCQAL